MGRYRPVEVVAAQSQNGQVGKIAHPGGNPSAKAVVVQVQFGQVGEAGKIRRERPAELIVGGPQHCQVGEKLGKPQRYLPRQIVVGEVQLSQANVENGRVERNGQSGRYRPGQSLTGEVKASHAPLGIGIYALPLVKWHINLRPVVAMLPTLAAQGIVKPRQQLPVRFRRATFLGLEGAGGGNRNKQSNGQCKSQCFACYH